MTISAVLSTVDTKALKHYKTLRDNTLVILSQLISYGFVLIIFWILGIVFFNGIGHISWDFITGMPVDGGASGGILPAIMGTLLLIAISLSTAMFFGIITAVYLSEYAAQNNFTQAIRLAILTLSGVPSIVFGLFGLSLFVVLCQLGPCALAGGLTLACMVLPTIIVTTEETLRAIPKGFREASLALGATKWQTIMHHVIPYAFPGILTGVVLSIGRVAGETAPIIFTAAAFFLPSLPKSVFDQVMALPYHLYVLATQHPDPHARGLQYAIALVLLTIVLIFNLLAFAIRQHYRKRYKW